MTIIKEMIEFPFTIQSLYSLQWTILDHTRPYKTRLIHTSYMTIHNRDHTLPYTDTVPANAILDKINTWSRGLVV